MTTKQVVDGLCAWALETLPELRGGYAFTPSLKTIALPDVVASLTDIELAANHPDFPVADLQQVWLRIWRVEMSFMVPNDNPAAAAELLGDFSDRLVAAIAQDATLGERVQMVSPFANFDFDAPFVEYQDGTRGREMTMDIAVAERVEAPA